MNKRFKKVETIKFPTKHGNLMLTLYESPNSKCSDVIHAIVVHTKTFQKRPYLRIHSRCSFSEAFGTKLCDCSEQLEISLDKIGKSSGLVVYLEQEGRSHGIVNKVKEVKLQQEQGLDTVEASEHLGLDIDNRCYDAVVDVLNDLKITEVRLLTNNPDKIDVLEKAGIKVERVPIEIPPTKYTKKYYEAKKKKLGHLFNTYL